MTSYRYSAEQLARINRSAMREGWDALPPEGQHLFCFAFDDATIARAEELAGLLRDRGQTEREGAYYVNVLHSAIAIGLGRLEASARDRLTAPFVEPPVPWLKEGDR